MSGLFAGIVGAGGNVGGMLFGFLFKSETISYLQAFTYIGFIVMAVSAVVLVTPFQKAKVVEAIEVETEFAAA
jgi:NNP family nitrate/nitrite transporter-like MFS transporter